MGRFAYTQRNGGDAGVWREEGELDFQLRKLGGLGVIPSKGKGGRDGHFSKCGSWRRGGGCGL